MKIKVQLSDIRYTMKPTNPGKITKELENKSVEIDIVELAQAVGEEGRTFTPACYRGVRRRENFIEQQVFALDFDDDFTIEEFKRKTMRYEIYPAIIYETFSSTDQNVRFRAIFVNDCVISNRKVAEILIQMLLKIFPEADNKCKDVSRMFYGGKNVVLCDEKNIISIYDVAVSLQQYYKDSFGSNSAREVKKVADELGVRYIDNLLGIYKGQDNDERRISSNIIILENIRNSSLFYEIHLKDDNIKNYTESQSAKTKQKIKLLQKQDVEGLRKKCQLFNDFYEGVPIDHDLKFCLASNLIYIKGGKAFFFHEHAGLNEKWKKHWEYMKKQEYRPQKCKNAKCPYYSQCGAETLISKLVKKIQKIGYTEKYVDIMYAEQQLELLLKQAIDSQGKGIRMIRAQTALGKTTTYCKMIKEYSWKKPVMIVVPTTKLQEEIGMKLCRSNETFFLTPNFEKIFDECDLNMLSEDVKRLYQNGLGYKAKGYIRKYINDQKDNLSERQIHMVLEYLEFNKKLDGTRGVITTHAMFLALTKEVLDRYEIIIDEDILMTIFKKVSNIEFQKIEQALLNPVLPYELKEKLKMILKSEDGSCQRNDLPYISDETLDEFYKEEKKEGRDDTAFAAFVRSAVYYVDADKKQISYFKADRLPDIKMTIISATLNADLYKRYLQCQGSRMTFTCSEIPQVEYKGKIYQYTAYSMSRSAIDKLGYDNVEAQIQQIVNDREAKMITFKKYITNEEIYFGKTEGFNEYEGKNLIVLGTPHFHPVVYQLIGCYLNYRHCDVQNVRRVEQNNYEFSIMTYGDINMQKLQFYFIESELEQAIGRARLLRYKCKVYVFSNYPCKQSEIIQDEYIKGGDEICDIAE